jgi:hypothetical protein
MDALRVLEFEPRLASLLRATHALLRSANLVVHPSVSRLILHGSRGLAGGYRSDSDIDLSLVVDMPPGLSQPDRESLLHDVVHTSLSQWKGTIPLDLAAVFDTQGCELKCFDQARWDEHLCAKGGVDCFGLYKVQKGFNGLVTDAGVQVKLMYPCLRIWQRA